MRPSLIKTTSSDFRVRVNVFHQLPIKKQDPVPRFAEFGRPGISGFHENVGLSHGSGREHGFAAQGDAASRLTTPTTISSLSLYKWCA